DVVAADPRDAGRRRKERREHVNGRRLPGSVRTEEAVDLTRRDAKVDPVDCARALLVLADELLDLDPVRTTLHRPTVPTGRFRAGVQAGGYAGSSGSFVATTRRPSRSYTTSTESFWR